MSVLLASLVLLGMSSLGFMSVQGVGLTCGSQGVVCFGLPTGCAVQNAANCDVVAKVNFSRPDAMVHVELSAISSGPMNLALTDRWIAVGFSVDGRMDEAPVVHCFEQNGKAVAKLTYNSDLGDYNEGWTGIDQTQLTADQLLVNEDALTCSVNLKPYVHIKTFTWDLSRQKHSLIAATGPMHNGEIAQHDVNPETSYPARYLFHA